MRILDIDLDIFVNPRKTTGSPTERPEDESFAPWPESQVRHFLECQCGLSLDRRLPGRVFREHDELFWSLKDEIARGVRNFDIVHADAHADLGIGSPSCHHIQTEWLARPVTDRNTPPQGRHALHLGSWLLYAVGARWIRSIEYVHHAEMRVGDPDVPIGLIVDESAAEWNLQLRLLRPGDDPRHRDYEPLAYEPLVPIKLTPVGEYSSALPFDRIYLTHSPGYTPPSADYLLDVIREYIDEPLPSEPRSIY